MNPKYASPFGSTGANLLRSPSEHGSRENESSPGSLIHIIVVKPQIPSEGKTLSRARARGWSSSGIVALKTRHDRRELQFPDHAFLALAGTPCGTPSARSCRSSWHACPLPSYPEASPSPSRKRRLWKRASHPRDRPVFDEPSSAEGRGTDLYALLSRGGHAPCARARADVRTHAIRPQGIHTLRIHTLLRRRRRAEVVRAARECVRVCAWCVCARVLYPSSGQPPIFFARSIFAVRSPRAFAPRAPVRIRRRPAASSTKDWRGRGWCHPRLISAGRAAKYARVGITFLRRHANPTAYTVRRSFTRCAH